MKNEKECKFCKELFAVNNKNRNNVYCRNCLDENKHHIRSKSINDLTSDPSRKRFLIKLYGIQCMTCKNTTWNNKPIPIQLDHIDGNSSNNIEENLRLLCPNCHAQTPSYAGRNKGNGRHKRRERYKLGLSY